MNRARARHTRVRSARRGFTLVEMLVAMSAGLMVTGAAFLLAKNASQVFQHEARISAAQLGASLGLNRLAADLQRVSFMASPNVQRDPTVCGSVIAPDGLRSLAGLQITAAGSYAGAPEKAKAQLDANDLKPDSIIIGGNLASTEQFPVRAITTGASGGLDVHLQTQSGAMVRTLSSSELDAPATLNAIFTKDRIIRFVDAVGRQEYGLIAGVAVTMDGPTVKEAVVQLAPNPTPQQKLPGNSCGYSGLGVGVLVNSLSRVQYRLESLQSDETYGKLVAPVNNEVTGDDGRLELVRTELDSTGAPIASTRELVAEYAVDLKFGLTTASTGSEPAVTRRPIPMDDTGYAFVGDVGAAGSAATPERVRAVQVRLSTRARAPDRQANLDVGDDGRRFRFEIPGVPPPSFARLRTLYADIALPNQAGITW